MKFVNFGKTSLKISSITLGTGSLVGNHGGYNLGSKGLGDFHEVVNKALDAGINCIDTAPIYGFGYIEEELSKIKKDFILCNKGGLCFSGKRKVRIDNSPAVLGNMLIASLKRLRRNFIDIYLLHWPDPNVSIEESLNFLLQKKKQGMIRYLGLSNYNLKEVPANLLEQIDVVQNECNIVESNSYNQELITRYNLGSMVYGVLGKGVFTGTKLEDLESNDYRNKDYLKTKLLEQKSLFQNKNITSPLKECLHFSLKECNWNHTCVIGMKNLQQVEKILEVSF